MKVPFTLLFAHARRTKTRTILTVVSVFVAVIIFGLLKSFLGGMEAAAAATNPNRLVMTSAISLFAHLPRRIEADLRGDKRITALTHWTWFGGQYKDENPENNMWARFGVDAASFRSVYGSDIELDDAAWKKFESTRTSCVVGEDLAKNFAFEVGSRVPLKGNLFLGNIEVEVVGIYKRKVKSFDANTLFFHWDYMNEVSKAEGGRKDVVSTYSLMLAEGVSAGALSKSLDDGYEGSENRTRTWTERQFQAQFNSMWGNVPMFFAVLGTVVMFACLMVTANTMVLNARERVQEVGVLKTLGFTPAALAVATLVEGLLLCLIGGGLALLLVRTLDGVTLMFVIADVPTSTILQGLGISAALGLVSGAIPAWIASRLDIVTAIRRRA